MCKTGEFQLLSIGTVLVIETSVRTKSKLLLATFARPTAAGAVVVDTSFHCPPSCTIS